MLFRGGVTSCQRTKSVGQLSAPRNAPGSQLWPKVDLSAARLKAAHNTDHAAQFKPPGGQGSTGPGNVVDNSLNITGPVGLDPGGFVQDLNALRTSQSRWAPLAQNLPQ